MKKLKINRRVITIATYTIAILSAICFAIYPETNAIFKKDNDKALAYISSLDNTYVGIFQEERMNLNRPASTIDLARITLTIPRDKRYGNENYIIEAISLSPNSTTNKETVCKVLPNTKSNNLRVDANQNISFTNNEDGMIDIECDVSANKETTNTKPDDILIKIKYYEAVSGEERFLFMDGFFNMTYEEYSAPYVEPPEGSIILFKDPDGNDKDSTTIYNEFMALVKKHASTSDYYNNNFNEYDGPKILESFVNNNNGLNKIGITPDNAREILLAETDISLLGVKRSPSRSADGELKGYGFEFDDNFIGYTKTFDWFKYYYKGTDFNLYFSNNTDIKEALTNSIEKWAYQGYDQEYTINGVKYTSAKLILNYIDKSLNGESYTLSGFTNAAIDYITPAMAAFPHIIVEYPAIDYAYNLIARDYGIIRVGYYENGEPYASDYEAYMKTTVRDAISSMFSETENISYDLARLLRSELNKPDTELYKQTVCKTNCSDYTELYYSDTEYYKVTIKHNTTEKYNEISITKATTFESVAVGLYDSNIISGIQNNLNSEGSLLNKAMTCSTTDCKEYNEIHYNALKNEYLQVNVTPNNTYKVNKIDIKGITFLDAIESSFGSNFAESINIGLTDGLLNDNIICNDSTCPDYYEIHYNTDTNNYQLVKVSHDAENSYTTLSFIDIKAVDGTSITEEAKQIMTNAEEIYIYIKGQEIDINDTLLSYLENEFGFEYIDENTADSDLNYTIVYIAK